MLNQPTDATKRRLALTAEIGAAAVLAALCVTLAVQRDTALAVILAVGSASFVVDATRRVRRGNRD
ncbi:hypothetical protein [Streptomyces resistomycificus]|uniref:Uncharacterized protein n=1 Tax=Streptomyces resistomycificus TaxID=67356 RepID=A0A0L8LJB6_9ACTN|nr:hypothetical protein [Streptomyces resistomycificus]KOG38161.1 hypothetical protein ADK37_10505 [Streptomyces resistomycificus]KUN98732.1 hypothetical protein AQJ84_13840 [Streptomyces resistomycificus]